MAQLLIGVLCEWLARGFSRSAVQAFNWFSAVWGESPHCAWQVEGTNFGPWFIMFKMLVVCVTLACVLCDMYTECSPMPSEAWWVYCMLFILVIIACVYVFVWISAGPDECDGRGPSHVMIDLFRAGLDADEARWLLGMTHCMFDIYGVRYFEEITKLCAYDFQCKFQVLPDRSGRAMDDRITHTHHVVPHFVDLMYFNDYWHTMIFYGFMNTFWMMILLL